MIGVINTTGRTISFGDLTFAAGAVTPASVGLVASLQENPVMAALFKSGELGEVTESAPAPVDPDPAPDAGKVEPAAPAPVEPPVTAAAKGKKKGGT